MKSISAIHPAITEKRRITCGMCILRINYWNIHKPVCFILSHVLSVTQQYKQRTAYRKRQKFRGWKVSRLAEFIRYVGKSFAIFSITTMVFQLYKTATSVSTKASCSSHKFSLKLSLAYLEMDKSTLLTHVCGDFTLSRMTMQLGGEELQLKWIQDETDC